MQGVPKLGYGINLFMPIFFPSPQTKLKNPHFVEKVTRYLFALSLLFPIPMTNTWKSVLIVADDALKSAADAGDRITEEVDEKFEDLISLLIGFEKGLPSKDLTSDLTIDATVTREARINDKSEFALTILHALKANLHANVRSPSVVSLPLNADEP